MKPLPAPPAFYFDKFSTQPVSIYPFDPLTDEIAENYLLELRTLLAGQVVEVCQRGSTALRISGKKDIDLGIFPLEAAWDSVLEVLSRRFGTAEVIEEDFARFNDEAGGYEVEIIVLKGYQAKVDRCLAAYLSSHPELVQQYEAVKRKNAHSKREYQRAKFAFFEAVIAMIPE